MMKQGEEIELPLDRKQLQKFCDDWCNNVYAHKRHSGLKGKTPFEMAAAIRPEQIRRVRDESACISCFYLSLPDRRAGGLSARKASARAA